MATSANWIAIDFDQTEIDDAGREAALRTSRARHARARARGGEIGTDEADTVGLLAEDATAKYEARPKIRDRWRDDKRRGFDVAGWGIRCRTKSWYGLYLYEDEREGRWLVALSHEGPSRIWLAGWISAEEFWQLNPVRRQHRGEAFWTLDQDHLHSLPEQNGYIRRGENRWLVDPQTPFWHEVCGRMHPIAEHRQCRAAHGWEPGTIDTKVSP